MRAQISKRYSYKSQPNAFKPFLNFLPNGPHKTAFGIFEILKIEILMIFFVFLNMGPSGSQNFKTLLLLQNRRRKISNFFEIFFPMVLTKLRFGIFEILNIENLMNFIRFP